jgi:hypothetical protein
MSSTSNSQPFPLLYPSLTSLHAHLLVIDSGIIQPNRDWGRCHELISNLGDYEPEGSEGEYCTRIMEKTRMDVVGILKVCAQLVHSILFTLISLVLNFPKMQMDHTEDDYDEECHSPNRRLSLTGPFHTVQVRIWSDHADVGCGVVSCRGCKKLVRVFFFWKRRQF